MIKSKHNNNKNKNKFKNYRKSNKKVQREDNNLKDQCLLKKINQEHSNKQIYRNLF